MNKNAATRRRKTYSPKTVPTYRTYDGKGESFKSIPVKNGAHTNIYENVDNLASGFFCDICQ